MNKKGQTLLITLIVLLILAVSSIVGISVISSKITSLSQLIERSGDWFSSVISSLEYGLYKLNIVNIPSQTEISIPYFGEENLIPFFKMPFTITIYGEQVLPVIYEGYFGFRDLIFPIQWVFKWLITREAGVIKELQINSAQKQTLGLAANYYGYYQTSQGDIICAPVVYGGEVKNIFNIAYAEVQINNCVVSNILIDNIFNSYTILGDNPNTNDIENFVLDIDLGTNPKFVSNLNIYINYSSIVGPISILYKNPNTHEWMPHTTILSNTGWKNVEMDVYTTGIRLIITPYPNYFYVQLSEVYVQGY